MGAKTQGRVRMRRFVWPVQRDLPAGPLVIRPARPADAGRLLDLQRAVLTEDRWFITHGDEFAGDALWMRSRVQTLNAGGNSIYLSAHLDGVLVGACSVQGGQLDRIRHVGRLEIFLSEMGRGRGVGRELLAATLGWAVDNPELGKLALNVFEDNTRAVALYQQFGFATEGRRVGEYRERDGTERSDLLMAIRV